MKTCQSCGMPKPEDAINCPSCDEMDEQVMQALMIGTPCLTTLMLVMFAFWAYRFWRIGWSAIGGNLRVAAIAGIVLGFTSILSGPLWTFGVRSRKKATILLACSVVAYIIFHLF